MDIEMKILYFSSYYIVCSPLFQCGSQLLGLKDFKNILILFFLILLFLIICDSALHTESQNHRIVGVGRDHCGSSSPTLLLKQGHLQNHRITESQN